MSCSVCADPRRLEIEAAAHGGRGVRVLSRLFGLSKSVLHRHFQSCAVEPAAHVANDELAGLILDCRELFATAKRKGDTKSGATILAKIADLEALRAARQKTAPREPVQIHVKYDDEPTPFPQKARDQTIANFLLAKFQDCEDEGLLKCVAKIVAHLQGVALPPELEKEVAEYVDLLLHGSEFDRRQA